MMSLPYILNHSGRDATMFGEMSVRKRLEGGEVQIGIFMGMNSPTACELAGHAGYDVLVLDHEHSPGDHHDAIACMNASRGTRAETWVRVPDNDRAYIKRILDCGATGVMCPMVNSAEEAKRLVDACHYAPRGIRGFAPTVTRHTNFGYSREAYFARVEHDLMVMAQIESGEAVDRIEEIAAVNGIDMLFIGPMDLSNSLGLPGRLDHPTVADTIRRAEQAIQASGKILGTLATPRDDFGNLLGRGYSFIIGGVDIGVLRGGLEQQVRALRAAADAARADAS
jgi:4-hydroxy-2-oxoheptanedioate aldolase